MRFAIGGGNSQTRDIEQGNTKYERLMKCFALDEGIICVRCLCDALLLDEGILKYKALCYWIG